MITITHLKKVCKIKDLTIGCLSITTELLISFYNLGIYMSTKQLIKLIIIMLALTLILIIRDAAWARLLFN
jgi:hypothetical protein